MHECSPMVLVLKFSIWFPIAGSGSATAFGGIWTFFRHARSRIRISESQGTLFPSFLLVAFTSLSFGFDHIYLQESTEYPMRSSLPQRAASLIRFRQKRKERCFDKKIRYNVRQEVALRYGDPSGNLILRQIESSFEFTCLCTLVRWNLLYKETVVFDIFAHLVFPQGLWIFSAFWIYTSHVWSFEAMLITLP